MAVTRQELLRTTTRWLEPEAFKDYCPNGLQVQGSDQIERIVSGVTACQALLDAAVAANADAVLVHHGYFWRGEAEPITGIKYQRIATLVDHRISLLAYHLPLDAHPEMGNNACLARLLGLHTDSGLEPDNPRSVGSVGHWDAPMTMAAVTEHVSAQLGRPALHIGDPGAQVQRVAWCTGAAQGYIEEAAAAGAELYISGEISEQTVHLARELGIHYLAAGHHATERYGVQALGEALAREFDLEHQFIDIDNPV